MLKYSFGTSLARQQVSADHSEGLPGVLGNKGTLAKYPREHELIFWEQGNKTLQIRGRKHCKQIHYKGNKYEKRAGTWEHGAILEGNKGPHGRPSIANTVLILQKSIKSPY